MKEADLKIRSFIKHILKINIHASNHIFYCPVKRGGLGIFEFASNIPVIMYRRLNNLSLISENMKKIVCQPEPIINRIKRCILPERDNNQNIKKYHGDRLEISFSGNGLFLAENHSASNNYILHPPIYWSNTEYIRSILLRFNLLPCKSLPSVPIEQRRCHAGCHANETLSHILQKCPQTHTQRILRHDYIVRRLIKIGEKRKWNAAQEAHLRTADIGLQKPDLILFNDTDVIICDVSICWEGPRPLGNQYSLKIQKYSNKSLIEQIQRIFPGKKISIAPLIIGSRGIWCKYNRSIQNHLKISKSDVAELIHTTIKGSLIAHKCFMKSVWE